jgi:hypothetical protein
MIANHSGARCGKLTPFMQVYLQSTLLAVPPQGGLMNFADDYAVITRYWSLCVLLCPVCMFCQSVC